MLIDCDKNVTFKVLGCALVWCNDFVAHVVKFPHLLKYCFLG